ncbi:hypothetical protein WMY93_017970 [Mugilogobius chulae]|uniref:Uncharacterized protein n=1 Tax=Mugilogobius chulae TaxID=88201 RepID=A0AAW0NUC4_9GOBI
MTIKWHGKQTDVPSLRTNPAYAHGTFYILDTAAEKGQNRTNFLTVKYFLDKDTAVQLLAPDLKSTGESSVNCPSMYTQRERGRRIQSLPFSQEDRTNRDQDTHEITESQDCDKTKTSES